MEGIYEIGLVGRVRWNLHSLNNEGTTGNVTEPRTVVLADGTKTDGVSGEMLQHIHVERMWQMHGNEVLCDACKQLQPTRINRVIAGQKKTKEDVKAVIDFALKSCAICDVHGFLVERPAASRNSTVLFGWAVGIPGLTRRDIHVHARHAPGKKEREKGEGEEKDEGVETEQMVYNRPTRSGEYAIQALFQPWRLGLNEVDYTYAIDGKHRFARYQLALDALMAMFPRTDGAMTTTRLPHVEAFQGILVISRRAFPAPLVSALREDYEPQVREYVKTIGSGRDPEVVSFDSLPAFARTVSSLRNENPFEI